ncbi:MAG: NAD(P)-dependent oxidoreductase [bacterium]
MKKVFITGLSGCVGHYIFDELKDNPELELYALVRSPEKLKFNPSDYPNLKIIIGDLKNITRLAETIKQMDYVIHAAAQWGGHEGNLDYSLDLFRLLDPAQCKKVIYFSTASILDKNNQPIPEAETCGTHYIRGKYLFHRELPKLQIFPNVTTLFLTWVLGGDNKHPLPHATAGLKDIKKWLWLIRWFTIDASFHYIHAADIAKIAAYHLTHDTEKNEYVLGNPVISASEFIKQVCEFHKRKVYFQIPISLPLVQLLAKVTGKELHSWDQFCFKKRHFMHQADNAGSFGLNSALISVSQILGDML